MSKRPYPSHAHGQSVYLSQGCLSSNMLIKLVKYVKVSEDDDDNDDKSCDNNDGDAPLSSGFIR